MIFVIVCILYDAVVSVISGVSCHEISIEIKLTWQKMWLFAILASGMMAINKKNDLLI